MPARLNGSPTVPVESSRRGRTPARVTFRLLFRVYVSQLVATLGVSGDRALDQGGRWNSQEFSHTHQQQDRLQYERKQEGALTTLSGQPASGKRRRKRGVRRRLDVKGGEILSHMTILRCCDGFLLPAELCL